MCIHHLLLKPQGSSDLEELSLPSPAFAAVIQIKNNTIDQWLKEKRKVGICENAMTWSGGGMVFWKCIANRRRGNEKTAPPGFKIVVWHQLTYFSKGQNSEFFVTPRRRRRQRAAAAAVGLFLGGVSLPLAWPQGPGKKRTAENPGQRCTIMQAATPNPQIRKLK